MKKITPLYLIAIILPLILLVVYLIPVQADTKPPAKPVNTTSACLAPPAVAKIPNDIFKVKIPAATTNSTTKATWTYVSPQAKKTFETAIAKKKTTSFSIFIAGYG